MTGKSMFYRAQLPGLVGTLGLAAVTGLTMGVAPSYGQVPSETSGLDQATTSALAAAKGTGERVKIEEATTETSEYFATPDGKVTGKIAAGVVRFRRDGAWVPVDLTLRRLADGSVAPTAHPNNLRISGARGSTSVDLASLGTDADRVTMGWAGSLSEPKLDGSKATYGDIKPGIDLVVQATATGFEQFTVVKSAAAAKYVNEISLPLTGPGVDSVSKDAHGQMHVNGAGGREHARIPMPMMWDAKSATGDKPKPQRRRQVTVDVIRTPAGGVAPVTLKLKPDQKWLNSPDTVYPVTIDPTIDWSTTATSTTVVKGYPTGWSDADSLFVGTYDATWSSRSFVTWYANRLVGTHIDSATAYFANPFSTSCTPKPYEIWTTAPITAATSWDNQPAWQYKEATAAEETATYDSEHNASYCDDSWVTADATSFFQRAATNNIATPTMGLRVADETDYSQYKQFWSHNYSDPSKFPYVEVTYSQPTQYTSDAFNQLLARNPDVTAAELDASMLAAADAAGLTYNQAVMTALAEAQRAEAVEGQASTQSVNTACIKRDLGTSRYRGDIFWAAASTYGVPHGHMGMFYQTNVVVEARGKGILSGSFSVVGRQYCKNIEKMDVATSVSTQSVAANDAYFNLRGKSYNSNFAWNKGGNISTLNCSELVYKAYKRAVNIDLDGNGGLGVYPNDIKNSAKTRTYAVIS